MFQLKAGRLPSVAVKKIIFITRPEVELMDRIAENLHGYHTIIGIIYFPYAL